MSNFEKVKNFMHVAEQNKKSRYLSDQTLVKFRLSLIEEELEELKVALKEGDRVETLDAIADLLYVIYGAAVAFDMDADKAFEIVHKSNMSKFCVTEKEAMNTVTWYQEEYKEGRVPYDTPTYKKIQDNRFGTSSLWVVYNKSTGKILKSIMYTPANLKEL